MRSILAFGLAAVMAAPPGALFAQRAESDPSAASAPAQSAAEERAAQLRAVVGLVTTPDSELNIANFEQIMESNDVRRIETAIRTLISSDDPALRGIAMRGYLAVTRDLVMDVVLSPAETKVLEEARKQPDGVRRLQSPNKHLSLLADRQLKIAFAFDPPSVKDSCGKVSTDPRHQIKDEYVVRGDRITFRTKAFPNWRFECDVELKPSKQAVIDGILSCEDSSYFAGPIKLAAPMF